MKDKKITNSLKFNKFSFLALLDGLDIFFKFIHNNIFIYLFFFEDLDNRISILIVSFIILLSFFFKK